MAHLETLLLPSEVPGFDMLQRVANPKSDEAPATGSAEVLPDLGGENYMTVLARLHRVLRPRAYLEIGVLHGRTLALSRCASIGIDPQFQFQDLATVREMVSKPALSLHQMSSDDFFIAYDPRAILGSPIEMAFLDGMHRCEFLMRDFINVERCCRPGSLILLHDCLPTEQPMTNRDQGSIHGASPHRRSWWTGDVWRTALLLKRHRPDLSLTVIDAEPTGLVMITRLDPDNRALAHRYDEHVREMMGWSLDEIGLRGLYEEMQVEPASNLGSDEQVTGRYCLQPL